MKINDPMESQYTNPPTTIDLTRKTPYTEASSLNDIGKEIPSSKPEGTDEAIAANSEKKIVAAEVVQGVTFNPDTVQKFDPTTIIPRKPKVVEDKTAENVFSQLDAAVAREKQEISKRHKELEEKMYEDFLDNQDKEEEEANGEQGTTEAHNNSDDDSDDDLDMGSGDSADVYSDQTDSETSYNIPDQNLTANTTVNSSSIIRREEKEEVKKEDAPVKIVRSVAEYDVAEFEKDFADDDDDLDQKDDGPTEEEIQEREREEAQKIMNGLKEAAQGEFAPSIFNKVDLRQFSISKTPVKASSIIVHQEEGPRADWVLYESGKCISMSALSGPELIQLDPSNSSRNRMNALRDSYKILYNHIIDENKPSFDKWMMQTKYNDLDHIYFCAYKATFGKSNFLSYQCNNPDCEHIFIKTVGFDEVVRYKDDSVKKRVEEIMSQSTNNGIIKYSVDLIQVSNTYVFGMRTPSLYNAAMENAGLSPTIVQKYGNMINVINYIDSVYTIDYANTQLVPIAIPKSKDNDPIKNITKKIKTIYRILRLLNSDEYYTLQSYVIKAEQKASDDITYFIPEAICPECGEKIKEVTEMNANGLLFTRHHLGAFASM